MQQNTHNPILVEFLGLPGCGKTTLVNAIEPLLFAQNLKVATKVDLHNWRKRQHRFINITLALKKPIKVLRQCFNIVNLMNSLDSNHRANIKRALTGIFINLQLESFANNGHFDVILLDQGALQNVWSIAAFSSIVDVKLLEVCVKDSVDLKGLTPYYINILATPTLSSSRIEERESNDSRFDLLNSDDRDEAIKKSYTLMTALFEIIKAINHPHVFLKADADINTNISKIMDKINALLRCNS